MSGWEGIPLLPRGELHGYDSCSYCGSKASRVRVTGSKKDGFFCQPVDPRGRLLEPWAAHRGCKPKGTP